MKVAQSYVLRLVYDDGVSVGDVQAVFDDGRAEQDIIIAPDEREHLILEGFGFHLPVGGANLGVRHQAVEYFLDMGEFLDLVVQEEYLPAAVEFVVDDALYFRFLEEYDFGLHRNAVRRRGVDDAEVAGAQQRELQGAGDGGGG